MISIHGKKCFPDRVIVVAKLYSQLPLYDQHPLLHLTRLLFSVICNLIVNVLSCALVLRVKIIAFSVVSLRMAHLRKERLLEDLVSHCVTQLGVKNITYCQVLLKILLSYSEMSTKRLTLRSLSEIWQAFELGSAHCSLL